MKGPLTWLTITAYIRSRNILSSSACILLITIILFSSCTKSNDPKPPISDSSYVINSLSVFLGGDSANWNVSTRNLFAFDSSKNQLTQTITESTFGDPNSYTYHTFYQYDPANRLQNISFERFQYIYKSMAFQYSAAGDIEKAVFTDLNGATIENAFTVSSQNGNTVITQYDTLASNMGKGEYFSNRPAIFRYTINAQGKLISLHTICSELYNGRPTYEDTLDTQLSYDTDNHLVQTMTHNIGTDNMGNMVQTNDTMQFVRDGTPAAHVQDLAIATLRNLDWLTTSDHVSLFKNLYSIQYGYLSREEPLKSTFDAYKDLTYSASYLNTFDSLGLLQQSSITTVEKNKVNAGNTTRETHYFTYLKTNK
jgi:hypothetical protein